MSETRDPYRDAEFTLRIKLPGEMVGKEVRITVTEAQAGCLYPLPEDRELDWCPESKERAKTMEFEREKIASHVARRLERVMLEVFASKDTVNGYPPKD